MQEVITYIIISFTFGLVIYKSIIKPIAKRITLFNKTLSSDNKQLSATPFCSSCGYGYKCDTCPFANAEVKKMFEQQKKESVSCCK